MSNEPVQDSGDDSQQPPKDANRSSMRTYVRRGKDVRRPADEPLKHTREDAHRDPISEMKRRIAERTCLGMPRGIGNARFIVTDVRGPALDRLMHDIGWTEWQEVDKHGNPVDAPADDADQEPA